MKRAAVIGHPVAHSKSPLIHGFWLDQLGMVGRYDRIDVLPGALADFCAGLAHEGFAGVNVTLPHKVNAAQHVAALTPLARSVGAVNTILVEPDGSLCGHNTDVGGFVLPLVKLADLRGKKVVVLGAGGAARAIVAGLAALGVSQIHVVNRTREAITALEPCAGDVPVKAHGWLTAPLALGGASLLVNTTSLGMAGQPPLQLDLLPLAPEAIVYDIVYAPLETDLLRAARARGLATLDGLEMLIGQAAEAFALFFGGNPNRAEDAALRARLMA
jgi:shikimate dehydrogenase